MATERLKHRTCTEGCDVFWHRDAGDTCWCCGAPGKPTFAPVIGGVYGYTTAITATEWAEVRRQVLPAA